MDDITNTAPKRKILSLKLEERKSAQQRLFVCNKDCVYMVWSPQGEMPKRVYKHNEKDRALSHAKTLTEQTGQDFYVMRSWRGFQAEAR